MEFFKTECLYVSAKTLFRKKIFAGLDYDQCWTRAIDLGWRWDLFRGKFYRVIGY